MKTALSKNFGTIGFVVLLLLFFTDIFVFENDMDILGPMGGWSLLFNDLPAWIEIPRGSSPVVLTYTLLVILLLGLLISFRKGKNHHFYLFLICVCGLLALFWLQEQLLITNSSRAKITLSHTISFYAMVFLFILIGALEYLKSLRAVSHSTANQPALPNEIHINIVSQVEKKKDKE